MSDSSFLRWREMTPDSVAPGVNLFAKKGKAIEFAWITLKPGTELKEHSHPIEQFFYILGGTLRYRVGREERVVGPGEAIFMPGGTPHWGIAEGKEDVVFIEAKQIKSEPEMER
jgi:quercetin dioxygenase-like cupin family protein